MSLRGDTLDRRGCLLGVEILCGLQNRLGGALGWGRKFEGAVYANKENEPKGNRAGSVCRGYDDVLN